MKNVLKSVLPVSAFVLAVAGAFAGNSIKDNKAALTDVDGHLPTASGCVYIQKCSDVPKPQMCTWNGQQLYRSIDGECADALFRRF